jgi:hypothetical protein
MPQRPRSWRRDSTHLLPMLPERFAEGIARARRDTFDGHRVLNVRPDPIDFRDRFYEPSLVAVQAKLEPDGWPADMIRNQGSEGACTGHALAAVIDVQNARRLAGLAQPEALGIPRRASARMLYEMARAHDDLPNDRLPGSSLRGALKGFFHNGVCGEDEAPYIPHEPAWRLEVDMAKAARRCGLGAYFRLRPVLYDYHAALNEVGCVLCSAMLHDGWQAAQVKRTNGQIVLSESEPKLAGAHAFAIVAYDPDGFLVLNSWGHRWGTLEGRPGMAHWRYDDWQRHVLDAWVLRLQVPSPSGFHLSGGWHERRATLFGLGRVTTPRIHINGHYVQVQRGAFVRGGTYANDSRSIEATAAILRDREQTPDYDHLLIVAESGLEALDVMVERAAVLTPLLKANRIYPLFLFWHTDLHTRLAEVLDAQAARLLERAGATDALVNVLVEEFARSYLRPLWHEMVVDAQRAAFPADRRLRDGPDPKIVPGLAGDVGSAVAALWRAAAERGGMQVHLAAHSSGAILLGHLLTRAVGDGLLPRRSRVGVSTPAPLTTVSLLAPACDLAWFTRAFAPARSALSAGRRPKIAVYALSEERETADRIGPYAGSLLQLAAAAFGPDGEDAANGRLLGLMSTLAETGSVRCFPSEPGGPVAGVRSHSGFASDEETFIHIMKRILETQQPGEEPAGR